MEPPHELAQLVKALERRGVRNPRVLAALRKVDRARFVPPDEHAFAYEDRALPIAARQTISQPFMVGLMTQELDLAGDELVLEIGTGSGYQTALLAELAREVVTIERLPELAEQARRLLGDFGYENVTCVVADGSLGWPDRAPYDHILVTAGAPKVPEPLYEQLRPGGRLVIPTGITPPQQLQVVVKGQHGPEIRDVCNCAFVPLIGHAGWDEDDPMD